VIGGDQGAGTRTWDDLLAGEKVTKQFWPEDLVLIEEFPITPSGKVQKFRLRESLL